MGIQPQSIQQMPLQQLGNTSGTDNALSTMFNAYRQNPPIFDQFERFQSKPPVKLSTKQKVLFFLRHIFSMPMAYRNIKPVEAPGEDRLTRTMMYLKVNKALSSLERDGLKTLLKEGVLDDTNTDDGHSTLYHLYSILTTPRSSGLDGERLLQETVRLLNKPYLITQKFSPLSENVAQLLMQMNNQPNKMLNRSGSVPIKSNVTFDDIEILNSATCVPSSLMYKMADRSPGELARHINELSSPLQAFYEKVKLSELSPDNPDAAYEILEANKIPYQKTSADEVMVKVPVPEAGVLRAINAHNRPISADYRTGVEALVQSSYMFLATKTYDPITDLRDDQMNPEEGSKGLTEPEKTLMENIIKDNAPIMPVTYQAVSAKVNPAPDEEGLPFLYGYNRSFEQTTQDIIDALNMGEAVIVGFVEPWPNGAIAGGHEITITSAFVDEKDGEIKFWVIDSDDDIPRPVVKTARELVPKIHHAGLPVELATKINAEIQGMQEGQSYLIPDDSDAQNFTPVDFLNEPMPVEAAEAPVEEAPQQVAQEAQQAPPMPLEQQSYPQQGANPFQQYTYSQTYSYPQTVPTGQFMPQPMADPNVDWVPVATGGYYPPPSTQQPTMPVYQYQPAMSPAPQMPLQGYPQAIQPIPPSYYQAG